MARKSWRTVGAEKLLEPPVPIAGFCIECRTTRLSVVNTDGICDGCKYDPRIVAIGSILANSLEASIPMTRYSESMSGCE